MTLLELEPYQDTLDLKVQIPFQDSQGLAYRQVESSTIEILNIPIYLLSPFFLVLYVISILLKIAQLNKIRLL